MITTDLTICSGNYKLPARLYSPDDSVKIAYVLHGATGVPRDYYAKFAEWLAEQGSACLLYSYRSDGAEPAQLKTSQITMADWGITDQNAALNALIANFPNTEYRVIGQSLGGFMSMFHDQIDRVSQITAVSSGPAYWARAPFPANIKTALFWYFLGPLNILRKGYLPGSLLGSSENIPKTAFQQWKRWCANRNLHKPEWGKTMPAPELTKFIGKLKLIGISDDDMIKPEIVKDLAPFYPNAAATFELLTPEQANIKSLGHLSIFRPKAASLWPKLL